MLPRPFHVTRGLVAVLLGVALLISLGYESPARADGVRTVDDAREREIRRLRNRLDNIDDEIRDAHRDIEVLGTRVQELGAQLAGIQPNFEESKRVAIAAAKDRDAKVKATSEAKSAKSKADLNYRATRNRLIDQLEADPELRQALAEFREAREAYKAAREAALAPLQASGEYRSALTAAHDASRKMNKLKADEETPRGIIALAARELLERQGAVSALEDGALARDSNYTRAWIRWVGSVIETSSTRALLAVEAYNDPQHLSAMEDMHASREAVEKTEAERDAAVKRQAQTERAFKDIAKQYDEVREKYDRAVRSLDNRRGDLADLQDRRSRVAFDLDLLLRGR
jgi:chromosome segregation ATPase